MVALVVCPRGPSKWLPSHRDGNQQEAGVLGVCLRPQAHTPATCREEDGPRIHRAQEEKCIPGSRPRSWEAAGGRGQAAQTLSKGEGWSSPESRVTHDMPDVAQPRVTEAAVICAGR